MDYTNFSDTPWYTQKCEEANRRRAEAEQKKGGCYLTTACIEYQNTTFDDNCYELTALRKFRDTYLETKYPEDIQTYYATAPSIVDAINHLPNVSEIWVEVYDDLIVPSIQYIENDKLDEAYHHYKDYSLMLAKKYLS